LSISVTGDAVTRHSRTIPTGRQTWAFSMLLPDRARAFLGSGGGFFCFYFCCLPLPDLDQSVSYSMNNAHTHNSTHTQPQPRCLAEGSYMGLATERRHEIKR
jgi:hypothetical protein